jgi:hypothetical protein
MKRTVIGSGGMVGATNSNGAKINGMTGQVIITTVSNYLTCSPIDVLNQGFWIPGVEPDVEEPPVTLNELYIYPNPATTSITVEYYLPAASDITFNVYDIIGKKVQMLYVGLQSSGIQKIVLETKVDNGVALSIGTYLIELQIRSAGNTGEETFNSYFLRNVILIMK